MKDLRKKIHSFLFVPSHKTHSKSYLRFVNILNKFSILFNALLSCGIVFTVEVISRRNFSSAIEFVSNRTGAFFYNALIVFSSLCLIYLFKRRAFANVLISSFWLLLGTINGCILSNRVTPFGFTDLKCISDLLAMNKTNYFTATEATLLLSGIVIFSLFCFVLYFKGPQFKGKRHILSSVCAVLILFFVIVPVTTSAAQKNNVVSSYFSNIAQGYENYGFIYGFSSSVVDRGMNEPEEYTKENVDALMNQVREDSKETAFRGKAPNIICILLESFCDPDEIKFLNYNEDPIPTFHSMEENFSTGYLTVPVVGAGTANSEFEILTGMSMRYFGTGEYPYKTILKKTNCESIAADLSPIGYRTHAVHNNGGNFYSRVNAFSMMGFDTFPSKELMDIREYTPTGSWASDHILVDETIKTLDSTPNAPDFTYTITVGTHGDYPKTPVIEDPAFTISPLADEETTNQWTYYINQLHQTDLFLANLIAEIEKRGEDTIIVAFGDHLPTMGLTEADMVSGDIFKTNYVTWNNMGLRKIDQDLMAYQLLATTLDRINIHEGTIMNYHQTQKKSPSYFSGLEMLQYDILYGERYCYNEMDKYPATDIVMGIDEVIIQNVITPLYHPDCIITGKNFTKWSKVYVNGKKVKTKYISSRRLLVDAEEISDGDSITVKQMGSSNSEFRTSEEYVYVDKTSANAN